MDTIFMFRFGTALMNCRRMLKDRGYVVNEATDDAFETASEAYKKAATEKLSLGEACRRTYHLKDPHSKDSSSISVWCLDRNYDIAKNKERMISTDQIKALAELLDPDGLHVILSPNKLSPQAKREYLPGELFLFDELMIDLPRHELVVAHRPISETEAKNVLGRSLLASDLPRLPMTDPMAKWHAFKEGQIVFIDNPSIPNFRIVVKT